MKLEIIFLLALVAGCATGPTKSTAEQEFFRKHPELRHRYRRLEPVSLALLLRSVDEEYRSNLAIIEAVRSSNVTKAGSEDVLSRLQVQAARRWRERAQAINNLRQQTPSDASFYEV